MVSFDPQICGGNEVFVIGDVDLFSDVVFCLQCCIGIGFSILFVFSTAFDELHVVADVSDIKLFWWTLLVLLDYGKKHSCEQHVSSLCAERTFASLAVSGALCNAISMGGG